MDNRIVVYDKSTQSARPLIQGIPPEIVSDAAPWAGIKLEHYKSCEAKRPLVSTNSYLAAVCIAGNARVEYTPGGNARAFRAIYEPGSVSFTGPGEIPAARVEGNAEVLVLELAPKFILWAADELVTKTAFEIKQAFAIREEQIKHIILAMHHELTSGCSSGKLFGEYMGLSFATALLTKHATVPVRSGQYKGGLAQYKLRRICEYIDANLASNLSLAELAEQLDMGTCHFARAFKESMGISPHQYVLRRRIEKALRLLKGAKPNLADMAYELGFSSQGHFTTVFHKLVGVPPTSYCEQMMSVALAAAD